MFLADTTAASYTIVTTLDGVTTVLTAFVFVCLTMPSLVRHKSQFYAAMACVAGIIAAHTVMVLFSAFVFGSVLVGGLQLLALLLLVLSVGGLTVKELGGEMAKAYEVIRRGETEKEVIIPIGERVDAPAPAARGRGTQAPRKVYKINTPPSAVADDDDEDKGIPLS